MATEHKRSGALPETKHSGAALAWSRSDGRSPLGCMHHMISKKEHLILCKDYMSSFATIYRQFLGLSSL